MRLAEIILSLTVSAYVNEISAGIVVGTTPVPAQPNLPRERGITHGLHVAIPGMGPS